jgi:uncharacterized membrane protein YfcA
MSRVARYRKFAVALLGAVAVIAAELPADAPSWLTGVFAVLSALAVLAVPNAQPGRVPPRAPKKYEPPRRRWEQDPPPAK